MRAGLAGRLTLVLVGLLLALGAALTWLTLATARGHAREVRQRAGHDIARHIAEDLAPLVDGRVDEPAAAAVFGQAMTVNPALQVYLLDGAGRVLAYDAPPGVVVRERVDLEPVRRWLEDRQGPAVLGDDPRSRDGRRVFSAWPVDGGGYVYAVLGGPGAGSGLEDEGLVLRLGLVGLAGALVVAAALGVALLRRLTRPLRRLELAMAAFEPGRRGALDLPAGTDDEVGRLGRGFERLAARIEDQLEDLRRVEGRRRELVASVSHDLRTPLAALRASLERQAGDDDLAGDERRRLAAQSLSSARRLQRRLGALFDLARLDAGDVVPVREAFVLEELVQDVLAEQEALARQRGVALELVLDRPPTRVEGDLGLLERALTNLLDNALAATASGGTVRVTIRRQDDGRVELCVRDTGRGIPADQLEAVFRRGHRLSTEGTGLGLAITRRVLALHGAELRVASRPGVGTRIGFRLPVVGAGERAAGPVLTAR